MGRFYVIKMSFSSKICYIFSMISSKVQTSHNDSNIRLKE